MQLPTKNTPIARCETASLYTQGALRNYARLFEAPPDVAARLESLAQTLEDDTATLMGAQAEYRSAVLALIPLRFQIKVIDLKADTIVRSVKRAAEEAGKDISSALFPNGMTPIIRPVGRTQVDALRALEARIGAASRWAARDEQLARVVAVRTEYEALLDQRRDAMAAAAAKRAARNAAKEDFLDVMASLAGAVREIFPRDRKRQDLFFDELFRSRRPRGSDATDVEDVDEDVDDDADE